MNKKQNRGFTLTEMLTTLAITSIMTASAVPSMANLTDKMRLDTTIQNLSDGMKLSRSEAVARNTVVSICARSGASCAETANWSQGWLIFQDSNRDGTLNDGETVIFENGELKGGINIVQSGSSEALSWHPDGTANSSTTLTACTSDASDSLVLNLSGRIQRQHAAGNSCENS